MRLMLGTPAYGGMVHIGYLNSLLEYQRSGIEYVLASIGNESLITRARNTIISYFYAKRAEYAHLLFLDTDVSLPASGLKALLGFDVEVVGAVVPLKGYHPDGTPKYNISGFEQKVADNLYTTTRLGTAVMLLSRDAVIDLVEKAESEHKTYRNAVHFDNVGTLNDLPMYDVFRVGVADGDYLSEDYWVCRELQGMGYDIHVTDLAVVTHHGMHAFKPQVIESD